MLCFFREDGVHIIPSSFHEKLDNEVDELPSFSWGCRVEGNISSLDEELDNEEDELDELLRCS